VELAAGALLGPNEAQLAQTLHAPAPRVGGALAGVARFCREHGRRLDDDERMVGCARPEAEQGMPGRVALRLHVDRLHGDGKRAGNGGVAVVGLSVPQRFADVIREMLRHLLRRAFGHLGAREPDFGLRRHRCVRVGAWELLQATDARIASRE